MNEYNFKLTYRLLRHTYATGLFDAGIDELSAAEIMGHDVNIMQGIYTHIQEGRKIQTISKIQNLYKQPDDNAQPMDKNMGEGVEI